MSHSNKMQKELETLHEEMELESFVTETGQRRRKPTRNTQLARTIKRKRLEKDDAAHREIRVVAESERLRGSQAAFDENVVQGSLLLDHHGEEEEVDSEKDDEMMVSDSVEETPTTTATTEKLSTVAARDKRAGRKNMPLSGKHRTRVLYQLKSFTSYKLAQRHGDALGAHARGMPKRAVEKLGEVACNVPAAPQVYSSLGLVYENLLNDKKKRRGDANQVEGDLELAKKTYGSYHIAALLCKKDFRLWVRAADSALQIADLYSQQMELATSFTEQEELRGEKKKWMEEAKKDLTSADNLKPPGIDVAAKLAETHMELGNLSESLTILTDLKNKGKNKSEWSFKLWLLYADVMLRIGYECEKWNEGMEENSNYMFRRWLRKYSETFDWQERRLQALCLALETAAGSMSCLHVLEWAKERARNLASMADNEEAAELSDEVMNDASADVSEGEKNNASADVSEGEKNNDVSGDDDDRRDISQGISEVENGVSNKEKEAGDNDDDGGGISSDDKETAELSDEVANDASADVSEGEKKIASVDVSGDVEDRRDISRGNSEVENDISNKEKEAIDTEDDGGGLSSDANAAQDEEDEQEEDEKGLDDGDAPAQHRPLSASCATVCNIASDLMKQCLDLDLFDGGRLVGEAVSLYMKERAAMNDKRVAENESFAHRQQNADQQGALMLAEPYDEIDDASSSDADESVTDLLSDDEYIAESNDDRLLDSLRKGLLPPEIRVLYAISLIGEGGKKYLASKCIESLQDITLEDRSLEGTDAIDTSLVADPSWCVFRDRMVEPLKRSAAFSLLVDVLAHGELEKEWCDCLEETFQDHVDYLEGTDDFVHKLLMSDVTSAHILTMKNHVLKIFLALARITLHRANSLLLIAQSEASDAERRLCQATAIASDVQSNMTKLQRLVWMKEEDGSISFECTEVLKVQARAFEIIMRGLQASDKWNDAEYVQDLLSKMQPILSLLCDVEVNDLFEVDEAAPEQPAGDWKELPLPSDWQSPSQESLSRLVYNLCVACSVSLFSGWESDEFSWEALKKRGQQIYFGINIRGKRVSGLVVAPVEQKVHDEWKQLDHLGLSWTKSFDFEGVLSSTKEAKWYKDLKEKATTESETVAEYGEEEGLCLLVLVSSLALRAAELSQTDASTDKYTKVALSVLLPLTQFLVSKELWDSPIGTAAASGSTAKVWQQFAAGRAVNQNGSKAAGSRRARSVKSTRSKSRPRIPAIKMIESTQTQIPTPPATKFARIPAFRLFEEWKADAIDTDHDVSDSAKYAMRTLDSALRKLRSSYSTGSAQKACIHVASCLLDVIEQNCGYTNPFLCLQQAVNFAGQGLKAGNNDEPFKYPLPREEECRPVDALVILGRADCLQALDFFNEAIFLCSFVARLCSLRRDQKVGNMPWTAQWKVLAIYAYNVRAAIDGKVRSCIQGFAARKLVVDPWDNDVLEELERGRVDAVAIGASFTGVQEEEEVAPANNYVQSNGVRNENSTVAALPKERPVENGKYQEAESFPEDDTFQNDLYHDVVSLSDSDEHEDEPKTVVVPV